MMTHLLGLHFYKSITSRLAFQRARLVIHEIQFGELAMALKDLDEGVLVYGRREVAYV